MTKRADTVGELIQALTEIVKENPGAEDLSVSIGDGNLIGLDLECTSDGWHYLELINDDNKADVDYLDEILPRIKPEAANDD